MGELRESLKEYARKVGLWWWSVVIGFILAGLAAVEVVTTLSSSTSQVPKKAGPG